MTGSGAMGKSRGKDVPARSRRIRSGASPMGAPRRHGRKDAAAAAVFLDRDGVICEYRADYVKRWEEFRFLPGTLGALSLLASHPGKIFVVSNQSCVGRGLVSRRMVDGINRRMVEEVRGTGGRIDGVLVCPHAPDERCRCRKPSPEMLEKTAREHGLDLTRCWVVGDNLTDIQMGLSAGCRTVMVRTGLGSSLKEGLPALGAKGVLVVEDLFEAVRLVMEPTARPRAKKGVGRV